MSTVDGITALFYEVDEQLRAIPQHPEARLWPSEVVTLELLHALKGGGNRPFYRWLTRDDRALFPQLPERTRLFRLCKTPQDWTQVFWAAPTVLSVMNMRHRPAPLLEGWRRAARLVLDTHLRTRSGTGHAPQDAAGWDLRARSRAARGHNTP